MGYSTSGDSLTAGRWFTVATKDQHDNLKRYGCLAPPKPNLWAARVQIGTWAGPGRYMVFQYTQRCPRNCCDDDVCKVIPADEVVAQVREEMRELASILKAARGSA